MINGVEVRNLQVNTDECGYIAILSDYPVSKVGIHDDRDDSPTQGGEVNKFVIGEHDQKMIRISDACWPTWNVSRWTQTKYLGTGINM